MMKHIMPSCSDIARLLSAGCERPLSFRERVALRVHVFFCVSCRRYASHLRWMKGAFRLLHHRENAFSLNDAARARIRDTLKNAASRLSDHD